MTAVELGGDLHCQAHSPPCLFHGFPFGNSTDEIAAEAHEGLDLAGQNALACIDGVEPLVARRLETIHLSQLVQRHQFRLLSNADSALTLYIRMAAHGRDAGALAADIALHQQQVDEHGHIFKAMHLLGQPHAINADGTFCF